MSFVDLATLVEEYLEGFPQNILFRSKLIQDNLIFRKQYVYFGKTIGEMRHGNYGICFSFAPNKNLLIYEGAWENDQYNGKGSFFMIPKYGKNKIYRWLEGQWKNGKLNGKGIIKEYQSQAENKQWDIVYKGTFKDHHKDGLGIQYFSGNIYQGRFSMGARLGQGRLTDVNGNFSDGNFSKGLPQGQGLQRKGAEVIVTDSKNTVSSFTVPEQQEKIGNFIQKIMSMI